MNFNYKTVFKMISISAVSFLLGGLAVVSAGQAIQAIQNDQIKVSLNGVVQIFKDETTGEIQYPITYNDRTYLPLRNVAQLAGLSVDYDVNSNTAILTKCKGFTNEEIIELIKEYYKSKGDYIPQVIETEEQKGNIFRIHAYDVMKDNIATSDWFEINYETGKGTNILKETIDLTKYLDIFSNAFVKGCVQVGKVYRFSQSYYEDGKEFGEVACNILGSDEQLKEGETIRIISSIPGEWYYSDDSKEMTRFVDYMVQREDGSIVMIGYLAGRV